MKRKNVIQRTCLLLIAVTLMLAPAHLKTTAAPADADAATVLASPALPAAPTAAGEVNVNGFFSVDMAPQGSTFQAAILLDIPNGLHVNSNRPLAKYSVPTVVKVEAPRGFRVTPVTYPRAIVRSFKFGDDAPVEKLSVYEGRALVRFNVTVPANFEKGVTHVRVRVRYQSCSDSVCYPPASRDLTLAIGIIGAGEQVQRVNGQYFGGAKRK